MRELVAWLAERWEDQSRDAQHVIVIVIVIDIVAVAVHVNGNDTVVVAGSL